MTNVSHIKQSTPKQSNDSDREIQFDKLHRLLTAFVQMTAMAPGPSIPKRLQILMRLYRDATLTADLAHLARKGLVQPETLTLTFTGLAIEVSLGRHRHSARNNGLRDSLLHHAA